MKLLMKIVSIVFHPLLMATYVCLLILIEAPELLPGIYPHATLHFLSLIFIVTAVMPALSILLLKSFRHISDLELEERKERVTPFLFILVYYGIACYLFSEKLHMEFLFNVVMISVTVLIFILLIITLKFKVSIHAAAIWGATGYLTAIIVSQGLEVSGIYYAAIVVSGLTSTSRLYLGNHTPREVWSGSIIGFSYSLVTFLLFA